MKRRWMVLPLALGLTLTLAACGGNDPKEDLVGAWSGQVDVMDQVVEGMRVTAPEIADELELENFYIPLEIEFRDDNTYIMTVDQEKLDESMDALIQKSVDATMVYMEQMLKEQGITDMTGGRGPGPVRHGPGELRRLDGTEHGQSELLGSPADSDRGSVSAGGESDVHLR